MHHETLSYILHRLPYDQKIRPAGLPAPLLGGEPPARRSVRVDAGRATLGASRGEIPFGWDNEFPKSEVDVAAFDIDVDSVSNRDFMEFVEAGGYEDEALWDEEGWAWRAEHDVRHPLFWELHRGLWMWRGMWDLLPLPMAWPAWVTHAEASAWARWKGRRLPTEAEYHRAAYGEPGGGERAQPWGDAPPDATRGHFDYAGGDPVPVASFPRGTSAWGVRDLVGNGWEWTSTVFAPFPGFEAMPSYPQYSADFFDGQHYVMKGASPATPKELVRRSFRNWFRPNYPVRVRQVPDGHAMIPLSAQAPPAEAVRDFAEDVRRDLALEPKQIQSKYLYNGLGSALFEAICRLPWYRITRAEGRAARAVFRRHGQLARGPDHLRRARLRQRREARDARREPPQPAQARPRPPDRHLARRPRALRAHPRRPRARVGGRPPGDVRGGTAPRGGAAPGARHDARDLPGLEHRQLRSTRRRGVSGRHPAAAYGRATRCCSARTSSSRRASCSSRTTIPSASRRPSTRTFSRG